jgi:hypothetical protein
MVPFREGKRVWERVLNKYSVGVLYNRKDVSPLNLEDDELAYFFFDL